MAKKVNNKDTVSAQLKRARRDRTLVKFSTPFDDWTIDGWVLEVGSDFFLLASLGEGVWLDGFQCFRIKDVRRLKVPHPHAAFAEAALRKRGQRLAATPPIDLRNVASLVRSAGKAFPLVVLRRDNYKTDSCWIGRVVEVTDESVSLIEINPDAQWNKKPTRYLLDEITQVSFGEGYEDALHLVGGRR